MINMSINHDGYVKISKEIEGGGWEIVCVETGKRERQPLFECYSIPQYGGPANFENAFYTLKDAYLEVENYT